jgi:hypothetical protein
MATAKKRTLIEPNPGDKRFVRRNEQGEFKESDDVAAPFPPTSSALRRPPHVGSGRQGRPQGDRRAQDGGEEDIGPEERDGGKKRPPQRPRRKPGQEDRRERPREDRARKTASRETAARQR